MGVVTLDAFGLMVGLEKKDAFEGWFSKVDAKEAGILFSVIWGYTTHEKTKHAFLQFTSSLDHDTAYISYPIEEMWVEENPFVLHIGNNVLSKEKMVLDFEMDGKSVKGSFSFGELSPIRTSFLKPGIMGWLTHFPNECNHGIISMNHEVSGNLTVGEDSFLISGAKGYMEKDWGISFPENYVWAQANDFEDSSIAFSYATVPMLGKSAKGFFLVLHHEGKEYRFSSIEGSFMLDFKVREDAFVAVIQKGRYKVVLKAKQLNPVALASPDHGEMRAKIKESLDGRMALLLFKGKEKIMELQTERGSIDVDFGEKAD